MVTAKLHGVKKTDTAWFNEWELIDRKRQINEVFPVHVAKKYLELREKKIIPVWVDDMTDLERMKLAAIE